MTEYNNNLDTNFLDKRVSTYKAVVSLVPYLGSFLSEFVGAVIPEQRLDRLVKYTKNLDEKIQSINCDLSQIVKSNEQLIDLIEEGFVQASRAFTKERREYIANIIVNSLTDEARRYSDSKYVLNIISELNDEEIIWLRFFLHPTIGGDDEFREKHENILEPLSKTIGLPEEELEKAAIQENYKIHLERLGLIKAKYWIDKKTKQPQLDNHGNPKISSWYLTVLGKYVLKSIGLIDE